MCDDQSGARPSEGQVSDEKPDQNENSVSEPDRPKAVPIGFLVVTRKLGEGVKFKLGDSLDEVHVLVNKIKDGQVRLSIYAPKSVKIDRTQVAHVKRLRRGRKA